MIGHEHLRIVPVAGEPVAEGYLRRMYHLPMHWWFEEGIIGWAWFGLALLLLIGLGVGVGFILRMRGGGKRS